MSMPTGEKGFSAAKAGRIARRATPARLPQVPRTYTVYSENAQITGSFKEIIALCPGIKSSTLQRRLACGERSLARLKRPAEAPTGPHLNRRRK